MIHKKKHYNQADRVQDTDKFKSTKSMALKITYEGEEIANKSYFYMKYMEDIGVTTDYNKLAIAFKGMTPKLSISSSSLYSVDEYSTFKAVVDGLRAKKKKKNKVKSKTYSNASLVKTIEQLQEEIENLRNAIG
jgi:hypothetical protein